MKRVPTGVHRVLLPAFPRGTELLAMRLKPERKK